MKKYTIQLLLNGRVIATNDERGIVVAGENDATDIEVQYPIDYVDYIKYVQCTNARGEYTTIVLADSETANKFAKSKGLRNYTSVAMRDASVAVFRLPSSMTFAGNTFLRFVASKDTELVAWADEPIPILKTAIDYRRPAMPTPDEIAEFIKALDAVKKLLQQPDRIEDGGELGVSISQIKGNLVFENMTRLSPYVQDDNWWINGEDTGVKASAVGIEDISETSRDGLYVTYTITYSDKHTQTFVIKDGELNPEQVQLINEANAFAKTANANSELARQVADSVRADADAGLFNGKDGADGQDGRDGNDGISIPADSGMYRLEIRSDGNLWVVTAEQDNVQPPLHIDNNGNLILTI